MEFEPVRRAGQEVRGPDRDYPGLMVVDVELSPTPPRDWLALWQPYPPNSTFTVSYGPPRVSGSRATLRVPDDKIRHAIEMLDGQITSANDWYEAEVLPRIRAAEERARKEAEEERQRLDDARRQLDELNDSDQDAE